MNMNNTRSRLMVVSINIGIIVIITFIITTATTTANNNNNNYYNNKDSDNDSNDEKKMDGDGQYRRRYSCRINYWCWQC